MILSDREIREYLKNGKLVIKPLEENQIKSACIDLTLGNEFGIFKHENLPCLDLIELDSNHLRKIRVDEREGFVLHPKKFVLGIVREYIKLPEDLAGYVEGRSSLGRLGVLVHITAGFIDPGWEGYLVLEMMNVNEIPVVIYPGMRVCKLVLFKLSSPSEVPYYKRKNAKYYKQKGVVGSKFGKET